MERTEKSRGPASRRLTWTERPIPGAHLRSATRAFSIGSAVSAGGMSTGRAARKTKNVRLMKNPSMLIHRHAATHATINERSTNEAGTSSRVYPECRHYSSDSGAHGSRRALRRRVRFSRWHTHRGNYDDQPRRS